MRKRFGPCGFPTLTLIYDTPMKRLSNFGRPSMRQMLAERREREKPVRRKPVARAFLKRRLFSLVPLWNWRGRL